MCGKYAVRFLASIVARIRIFEYLCTVMKRIYLSNEEKKVLRELRRGNDNIPNGMDNFTFADVVTMLTEKQLVRSAVDYERVSSVQLTAKGHAYLSSNPLLLNPIDWALVAAIAACAAAVSATLALFVSCVKM